jgi:hypothetical protein
MTLRELLSFATRSTRATAEQVRDNVLRSAADLRDLTRPVRRRSRYPTILAVHNSLKKLETAQGDALKHGAYLFEQLKLIRAIARKETTGGLPAMKGRASA